MRLAQIPIPFRDGGPIRHGADKQPLQHLLVRRHGCLVKHARHVVHFPAIDDGVVVARFDRRGDRSRNLVPQREKLLTAHQLLQQSEEKYSTAFHLVPVVITISNFADGRYVEVSDYFLRLSEYTRDEVIGHTSLGLGIWVKREEHERVRQILKDGGRVVEEEILFQSRSGKIYTMLFSAEIVSILGVPRLVSVAIDLTERRRAEEALRESEELYTRLVDTIPDIIVRTDLDGKIFFVNNLTLHISGYSRKEIEGQNILMFIAPEDQNLAIQNMPLMTEKKAESGRISTDNERWKENPLRGEWGCIAE